MDRCRGRNCCRDVTIPHRLPTTNGTLPKFLNAFTRGTQKDREHLVKSADKQTLERGLLPLMSPPILAREGLRCKHTTGGGDTRFPQCLPLNTSPMRQTEVSGRGTLPSHSPSAVVTVHRNTGKCHRQLLRLKYQTSVVEPRVSLIHPFPVNTTGGGTGGKCCHTSLCLLPRQILRNKPEIVCACTRYLLIKILNREGLGLLWLCWH